MVSKAFLSLTNRLQVSFRVINASKDVLSKHLERFPNLKKIDLSSSRGRLEEALHEIMQSQVKLDELDISRKDIAPIAMLKELGSKMNLKVFRCSHSFLSDMNLISMADDLTSIEELDVSQQYFQAITDEGIIEISKKLKCLQRIDLTGNGKITDHSVIALATNCKLLTKVVLRHCPGVTQAGISFLMRNSPRYNSLILESTHKNPYDFKALSNYPKLLSTIEFSNMEISNNILHEIGKANLPLKFFRLSFCTNFTIDGLSSLLKGYRSLESLALDGAHFLTDECLKLISPYLREIISINLNSCFKLTISSFLTIALSCPHIKHMEIVLSSSSDKQKDLDCSSLVTAKNLSIKSASITCTSTTLESVLSICPNLEALNVTTLVQSHELDIAYIVNNCSHLRHLAINHSERITFSEKGDEEFTCKLESLSARKSRVDDQLLRVVGTRCPSLLDLKLQDCMSVTEGSVKYLVESCKRIRYMNLNWSIKVDKPLVAWLVASCPSLRQIVVPYGFDQHQADDFLMQGCVVHLRIWEDRCFYSCHV